jgi:hypothetical protein
VPEKLETSIEASPTPDAHGDVPIGEMVNLQEGRTALEDPNLAKVVDVFKGRIVDIQHNAKNQDS